MSSSPDYIDNHTKVKIICTEHGDRYGYELVKYININTPVEIICKKHGNFWQKPEYHIDGSNCPTCALSGISQMEIDWLDSLGIELLRQYHIKLGKKKIRVDGYDPITNTVYEFHGNYWHGNPQLYNPEDINEVTGTTFRELYKNTLEKEKLIVEAGYNLVVKWESDII